MSISFLDKLQARIDAVDSLLCVGLDPHSSELNLSIHSNPNDAAFTFCHNLILATSHVAACYKPNAAFFEALGDDGIKTLRRVCDTIPRDIPILLDVKRGDIGTTAQAYASACYDHIKADAVTLSPLMGMDSMEPFVTGAYSHKAAFVLCKTSNPGSNDLLTLPLQQHGGSLLYEEIARFVAAQKLPTTNLGLVVGATDAVALQRVRRIVGDGVWILAPGIGAQGGNLREALEAGLDSHGSGMLIPVSRGISGADHPKEAANELVASIRSIKADLQLARQAAGSCGSETSGITIQPHQRKFLEFSLDQQVLKFGSFVLKSGRTSPYFFNAGLFASGRSLHRLAKAYAATIMSKMSNGSNGVNFDVVFGPAYKGISLGAVVSSALYSDYKVDVEFSYNRKEAKDHGEGGTLVGASMQGKRVLIVDDVITAGTAIRDAYELLVAIDAQPVGVVIALDRDEIRSEDDRISAVQAVSRDLSIQVASIVGLKELQAYLELSSRYDDETLQSVVNYRKLYGAS